MKYYQKILKSVQTLILTYFIISFSSKLILKDLFTTSSETYLIFETVNSIAFPIICLLMILCGLIDRLLLKKKEVSIIIWIIIPILLLIPTIVSFLPITIISP